MKCIICNLELTEADEIITQYGLDMHKSCEEKFIYYTNPTYRDYIKCCNVKHDIIGLLKQGKFIGIGKCKICGKTYITSRLPKNPKPRKPKAPERYSDDAERRKMFGVK